jgi:hypothetical protein
VATGGHWTASPSEAWHTGKKNDGYPLEGRGRGRLFPHAGVSPHTRTPPHRAGAYDGNPWDSLKPHAPGTPAACAWTPRDAPACPAGRLSAAARWATFFQAAPGRWADRRRECGRAGEPGARRSARRSVYGGGAGDVGNEKKRENREKACNGWISRRSGLLVLHRLDIDDAVQLGNPLDGIDDHVGQVRALEHVVVGGQQHRLHGLVLEDNPQRLCRY